MFLLVLLFSPFFAPVNLTRFVGTVDNICCLYSYKIDKYRGASYMTPTHTHTHTGYPGSQPDRQIYIIVYMFMSKYVQPPKCCAEYAKNKGRWWRLHVSFRDIGRPKDCVERFN